MRYRFYALTYALVGCFIAPSGAFLEMTANLDKKRCDDEVEMRQVAFHSLVHRVEKPRLI